jgi:TolB protein
MPFHPPHLKSKSLQLTRTLCCFFVFTFLLTACAPGATAVSETQTVSMEVTFTPTAPAIKYSGEGNIVFLSIQENGYAHLFIQNLEDLPLTRITDGEWNDIAPALSPDRKQLAFASNRSGYWDLYLMDLNSGSITQITNTPEYDASPSWSPDGQWLVFETYVNENLEVSIVSVNDRSQAIIPVTNNFAGDHSPVWSPDGRRVAFISSRSGDSDIWLANLDLAGDERFQNLSNTPYASESHPVWNYDGTQLLWASSSHTIGLSGLYIWSAMDPTLAARWVSDGSWGAWNETAQQIFAVNSTANEQYITVYDVKGMLLFPPTPLAGTVRGLTWGAAKLPNPLPEVYSNAAANTPAPLWAPIITPVGDIPDQRWYVVPLENVQAPYPQMHELVDESFIALRNRLSKETGWDALASLENAFVPLTTPLEPGMNEDWVYTGRAFAINSLMTNAGWMVATREDIGAQTYWRLFIRCTVQDGSLGEPLHDAPWNLNARYELNPQTYEQGGDYSAIPSGYWVDVTSLAAAYDWDRLPALPNWRTFYAGARFTEFALTSQLDWYTAMRELYPAEALITPTRVLAPSLTPTRTATPTSTRPPTRTPRATFTPSLTFTPSMTFTPPPSPTLSPTPPTIVP